MKLNAIGLVETTSIARAHAVEDAMLKTAEVKLLLARTICSGKFIVIVGGDVANVLASVAAGAAVAAESLIEERVISRVHPAVFPALSQSVELEPDEVGALGVVETF
jgi:microcompartment protein CcmL/EutN